MRLVICECISKLGEFYDLKLKLTIFCVEEMNLGKCFGMKTDLVCYNYTKIHIIHNKKNLDWLLNCAGYNIMYLFTRTIYN